MAFKAKSTAKEEDGFPSKHDPELEVGSGSGNLDPVCV